MQITLSSSTSTHENDDRHDATRCAVDASLLVRRRLLTIVDRVVAVEAVALTEITSSADDSAPSESSSDEMTVIDGGGTGKVEGAERFMVGGVEELDAAGNALKNRFWQEVLKARVDKRNKESVVASLSVYRRESVLSVLVPFEGKSCRGLTSSRRSRKRHKHRKKQTKKGKI